MALSISLISLLITGLDASATAQIAYARAFSMTPLCGVQKYLRGAAWLILLLADTGAALTLRSLATHHPLGFALAAGAELLVLEFGFFLATPRLLLDLPLLASFAGVIASFWVWIVAVMGVWWERRVGPAVVAAMEELSADLSAS